METSLVVKGILLVLATGVLGIASSFLMYRKSIMLKIIVIFTIPLDVTAIVAFVVGAKGLSHALWAVPAALICIFVCYTLITNIIRKPLQEMYGRIDLLSEGDVDVEFDEKYTKSENEISGVMRLMQKLAQSLRKTADFAGQVGKGNFTTDYHLLSDKDKLGQAMLDMRENLREADKEIQKRKEDDERRNWITEGVAKFGELLRANNEDLTELSNSVISNLVKYIDANQGGIYILNDEDNSHPYLEMTAFYAYERKKMADKKIEIGEGLVGTCFLEKESIYMTNLPKDYVRITSGLGDDTPRALLITPLKVNDEIYGVIELASFNKLEPHVIEFVEKIAESIASSVGSVKTHMRTNTLLEMSKLQAEEMANQEEELRQNMEEMQATQEEMRRRETELSSTLEEMKTLQEANEVSARNMDNLYASLSKSFNLIGFSPEGTLIEVNESTLKSMDVTEEQCLGSPISAFVPDDREILARMKKGEFFDTSISTEYEGKAYTTKNLFVPFMDAKGNLEKFILVFYTL